LTKKTTRLSRRLYFALESKWFAKREQKKLLKKVLKAKDDEKSKNERTLKNFS
jgi:hypothetical protein